MFLPCFCAQNNPYSISFTDLDFFIRCASNFINDQIENGVREIIRRLPDSEILYYVARQLLKESVRNGTTCTTALTIAKQILAKKIPQAHLQYIIKGISHLARITQNVVKEVGKAALKNGGTKEAAKKVITKKVMTQVTSKKVTSAVVDEGGKKVVKKTSELAAKRVSKEVVEEAGKKMAEKGSEVVVKKVTKEVVEEGGKKVTKLSVTTLKEATKEATEESGKKMLAKGAQATAKGATKGVAGETVKQVSFKAASKAGWECAKKVPKQALICGAVVDTAFSAYEIGHAYKQLCDGEIDQHQFRCRSVRSVSSGVGSTAGGVGGATLGTYIGATIGTLVAPGVGTGIGASVGGFLGSVFGGTGGAMVGGHVGDCINQELDN